jgi:arylsulfatase A-like enzyme
MESASYHETSLDPGSRYDTTPFLKQLGEKSLVFTDYYSGVAASTRTFLSALTGLQPFVDKRSDLAKYSQIRVPTLVDILHEQGYATAFFTSSTSLFDSLDSFLNTRPYDVFMDMNLLPSEQRRGAYYGYWGVDEEIAIDQALEWVERAAAAGRPFLLNYNAVFPHHPYNVPPRHKALTRLDWGGPERHARYRASLRYSDQAVRRLHDGLARLGLLENTLFVVTPDHGEAFGDRHPGNLLHAGFAYDDDQRVFLMLHNPRVLGPARRSDRLGSHADLLPTLLQVLGLERDLDIDGQSLLSERFRPPQVFTYSRRQLSVREGDLKLVTNRKGRRVQLFDLARDPLEQRNIAAEHPETVAALERTIKQWRVTVTRGYRDRVAATGLDDKQRRKRVKQQRRARLSGRRHLIEDAGLCVAGAQCPSTGSAPRFGRDREIVVWARLRRAGRAELRLDILDDTGAVLRSESEQLSDSREVRFSPVAASTLPAGKRFRARVSAIDDRKIHDLRVLFFYLGG